MTWIWKSVVFALLAIGAWAGASTGVRSDGTRGGLPQIEFTSGPQRLVIEILNDKMIHCEYSRVERSPPAGPIYLTPYVDRRKFEENFSGPTGLRYADNEVETLALKLEIDPQSLCVQIYDKFNERDLTRICPMSLDQDWKGLTLARGQMTDVYGLGEQFLAGRAGTAEGNWNHESREPGEAHGNALAPFHGGAVGNAQFPILYALGPNSHNYALFLDQVYKQRWDFRDDPWRVEMWGDQIRFFFIAGEDLPELRTSYMKLVGHPLVPPKKAFGLWVSEYGFNNWSEVRDKLRTLRANHFPVDGFVLDLQWFGGVRPDETSSMGSLRFDEANFPRAREVIREFRDQEGVGLMTIEESYVSRGLPEHAEMEARGYLARERPGEKKAFFVNSEAPWWGRGGMIDWTHPEAGRHWHRWKRQPLVDMGIMGHWTDLGEPEMYRDHDRPEALPFYHGFPELGKFSQADVHNVFSLLWSESIYNGYREHRESQRPWILSRSGGPGIQRYGTGMWSGDIGSNLASFATHLNVQMQMSLSGIDYFGSDIGGFHRGAIEREPGTDLNEMYTQWFAGGAALDVPVRPHTENIANTRETAPDRIGDLNSNLANIRLRYELSPYYYSLAHRAYLFGEPVMPPLVYYYQDAPADRPEFSVRTLGNEKLVGPSLLFAMVARSGERARDVYLPPGEWIDYHSHRRFRSEGKTLRSFPVWVDGVFRLPLFVRAGAILPKMFVDEKTMNIEGRRSDGSVRNELIARVYVAGEGERHEFTIYEDDGRSNEYQNGRVATTRIESRRDRDRVMVTVDSTAGSYDGAPVTRATVIELVPESIKSGDHIRVWFGQAPLPRLATRKEFDLALKGFYFDSSRTMIFAKAPPLRVDQGKDFEFSLDE